MQWEQQERGRKGGVGERGKAVVVREWGRKRVRRYVQEVKEWQDTRLLADAGSSQEAIHKHASLRPHFRALLPLEELHEMIAVAERRRTRPTRSPVRSKD